MRRLKKCTIHKEYDGDEILYFVETNDGFIFDDGSHLQIVHSYKEALEIARTEIIEEE